MMKLFLICLCLTVAYSQYSNTMGLKYLHFAKTTYCEEKNILDWNCEACHYNSNIVHRFVITNPKFESLSFVGLNKQDKEIIVAFRGSDNFRNWLTNLNFLKKSYSGCSGCQVHSGFQNAWQGQKELISNRVKVLLEANPGFKVSVVGHSLGGAIATICAVQLQEQGIPVENLITFGAPRPGNYEFANYVQTKINHVVRIVRRKDPVPHVPPRSLGFRNFGTEHFYDNKDDALEYETCHLFDSNTCSNNYLVIQTALSVSDHLNYLGRSTDCGEKLSMGLQQEEGEDIKLKSQDGQYDEFADMVESEYDLGENYHKIDLDDEEAAQEWRIQLDDDDMDYLIIVD